MLGAPVYDHRLTARDDLHDFQPVAGLNLTLGKLRRRDRLAIVLHHHAARQKLLRHEKFFQRAGQFGGEGLAVRDDGLRAHENKSPNPS